MKGGDEKKPYNVVSIKIMKKQTIKGKFIYIKMLLFLLMSLYFIMQSITVKAVGISLSSITFDDHKGMKAYINGKPVYCIQRGYPFRSAVSELQMVHVTLSDMIGGSHSGTIASEMRLVLWEAAFQNCFQANYRNLY